MNRSLIFILFFNSLLLSQSLSISGKIVNSSNENPIPFVNIGIKNTYYGTSTNEQGNFKLILHSVKDTLIISCVGFETKTIIPSTRSGSYSNFNIALKPITIQLPEVLVDADEDPAYGIIRKAIENKEKLKEGLRNYHYDFYSKNILYSGKEIVFIEEDLGEGFHVMPDSTLEVKNTITKTENIKAKMFRNGDLNFFEKKVIDFSLDSLTLGKFVFHLPLSIHAFDYYDYKLLGISQRDDVNIYEIQVIPYSKIRPTFAGKLYIQDSSYVLTNVSLSLENRNLIPFTDFKISVYQNMQYYNGYWFPKYYNINVETNMNYYHLISLDSAITSYVKVFNNINTNLEDTSNLVRNIKSRIDSSKHNTTNKFVAQLISKEQMDSLRLYPLTGKEYNSYSSIDSSKDIISSLKLGGIGGEYLKQKAKEKGVKNNSNSSQSILSYLQYLNLKSNRVDGLELGLMYDYWVEDTLWNINGSLGYSLERNDVATELNLNFPVSHSFIDELVIGAKYGSDIHDKQIPYNALLNSIAVTFGFEDQFNYYFSRKISLSATKNFNKKSKMKFDIIYDSQKSLSEKKYYSIFNSNRVLRENFKINEGLDNRIQIKYELGVSPYIFDMRTVDGIVLLLEHSNKIIGSDFNYTSISFAGQFFFNTLYDELFFSPFLDVFIEGKAVWGNYGIQHLLTPNSALGVYSPVGTFKVLKPYQFVGDKYLAIHIEHNWRKTFFDMLGIYFPVAWNLELTTGINGLQIWNNSKYFNNRFEDKFYWEVYGGISGILGLFNLNVAYNKYKNSVVRFGFSKVF